MANPSSDVVVDRIKVAVVDEPGGGEEIVCAGERGYDVLPELVVRLARDRNPDGDDLAELLADETGAPFDVGVRVVRRAIADGYLEYNELTGDALNDSVPTNRGLALVDEYNRKVAGDAEREPAWGWTVLRLTPDVVERRPAVGGGPPMHGLAGLDVVVFNPARQLTRWLVEHQMCVFTVDVWSPLAEAPKWAHLTFDRFVVHEFTQPADEPFQLWGRVAVGGDGLFYQMRVTTEEPPAATVAGEGDDPPCAVRVWRDTTRALWDEDADGRMWRVDSPDGQDQGVPATWVHENFGPLTQERPQQ